MLIEPSQPALSKSRSEEPKSNINNNRNSVRMNKNNGTIDFEKNEDTLENKENVSNLTGDEDESNGDEHESNGEYDEPENDRTDARRDEILPERDEHLLTKDGNVSIEVITTKNKNKPRGRTQLLKTESELDVLNDYSIKEMLEFSIKNQFPWKKIVFGRNVKLYSPILNFYNCSQRFEENYDNNTQFNCKVCGKHYTAKFGSLTNLNKHIRYHQKAAEIRSWYEAFQKSNESPDNKVINDDLMNLILFFLTSNVSLDSLENTHLRNLLAPKIENLGKYTFRNKYLPLAMEHLHKALTVKFKHARTVALISDLWSTDDNRDFLGLGAVVTNALFEKSFFTAGMIRMEGKINTCFFFLAPSPFLFIFFLCFILKKYFLEYRF